ncbi:putative methyltransferase PMT2 [Glycine soja]
MTGVKLSPHIQGPMTLSMQMAFLACTRICNAEDILLEMDRILRPEGAVIFRDQANMLMQVKRTVKGMRWNTKMVDHEDGPLVSEKVLFAVKQYWAVGDNTMSSV